MRAWSGCATSWYTTSTLLETNFLNDDGFRASAKTGNKFSRSRLAAKSFLKTLGAKSTHTTQPFPPTSFEIHRAVVPCPAPRYKTLFPGLKTLVFNPLAAAAASFERKTDGFIFLFSPAT